MCSREECQDGWVLQVDTFDNVYVTGMEGDGEKRKHFDHLKLASSVSAIDYDWNQPIGDHQVRYEFAYPCKLCRSDWVPPDQRIEEELEDDQARERARVMGRAKAREEFW